MVAAREVQMGMREGQLERSEEDSRRREEQLRIRESEVHAMQLELESVGLAHTRPDYNFVKEVSGQTETKVIHKPGKEQYYLQCYSAMA